MTVGALGSQSAALEVAVARARALHGQMEATEKAGHLQKPDVATHVNARRLRREAREMLYSLEALAKLGPQSAYPKISVHLQQPGKPTVYQQHDSGKLINELVALFKHSIFIKDGGKSIYQNRPKNMPFYIKCSEQSKDLSSRLFVFSQRHPYQAGAIAVASIVVKILFGMFVFGALVALVRQLLGLKPKHPKAHAAAA